MRPSEVLDAQADLLDRLGDSLLQRVFASFAALEALNGKTSTNLDLDRAMPFVRALGNHTRAAYAYRVTHDMSSMIQWTASQIDGTDQFHRALLPTECGIVCFDKPLPLIDIRGKEMLIHWMIWGPVAVDGSSGMESGARSATMVWMFNDSWRQPDEVQMHFKESTEGYEHVNQRMGRWANIGMSVVFDHQRIGPERWSAEGPRADQVRSEGFEPVEGTNAMRYFQSLLMLLNQTVTTVADEDVDRSTRRRATKKGIPGKISVVRLRRSDSDGREPGESHAEWSHRWIVRRHWRWQPYGSRRAPHEGSHVLGPIEVEQGVLVQRCVHSDCDHLIRRIIINAHEKGPAEAPLLITEKVYSLER